MSLGVSSHALAVKASDPCGRRLSGVRDSKNPEGPRLALASAAWSAFLPYAVER
ncbi:DUF397 domain-containing protein [Streptomyces sp. NPDC057236]|uniref:DUF397 domain-containing protein n=1 Tax=Streptomyces sp. NPDC057236 TaxID=3346059 RepID=UPI0036403CB2